MSITIQEMDGKDMPSRSRDINAADGFSPLRGTEFDCDPALTVLQSITKSYLYEEEQLLDLGTLKLLKHPPIAYQTGPNSDKDVIHEAIRSSD